MRACESWECKAILKRGQRKGDYCRKYHSKFGYCSRHLKALEKTEAGRAEIQQKWDEVDAGRVDLAAKYSGYDGAMEMLYSMPVDRRERVRTLVGETGKYFNTVMEEGEEEEEEEEQIEGEECEECAICLGKIKSDKITTACNHTYHKKCLNKWKRIHSSCPLCRKHI